MTNSYLFCNLANGVGPANIVYQTDLVCCFLDIAPINEGHTLIVPKKHMLDIEESDEATRLEIMNTAALLSEAIKKAYSPDGISMIQNGGYFNDVNHYHMHVFPRYKNDGFAWVEPKKSHLKPASQVATNLYSIINKCNHSPQSAPSGRFAVMSKEITETFH